MISRLHYITQHTENFTHAELAEFACKGGVNWVQLRVKNGGSDEWEKSAIETQTVCKKYQATFIINDQVYLAKEIGADGVHLGKEDMKIQEARKILGNNFIIGGSANTIEDVERLIAEGIDYIGIGPFRFTSTKEKLNPVLGIGGYTTILKNFYPFVENKKLVPIIAIGGITLKDVDEILSTGVYGIAISSAINLAENKLRSAEQFIQKINQHNISSHV